MLNIILLSVGGIVAFCVLTYIIIVTALNDATDVDWDDFTGIDGGGSVK